MGHRAIADTEFARWLDTQIEQRKEQDEHGRFGVRSLAKIINADEPETARRALNRFLFDGSYPEDDYRKLIAAAFDVEEASLPAREAPFRNGKAA